MGYAWFSVGLLTGVLLGGASAMVTLIVVAKKWGKK